MQANAKGSIAGIVRHGLDGVRNQVGQHLSDFAREAEYLRMSPVFPRGCYEGLVKTALVQQKDGVDELGEVGLCRLRSLTMEAERLSRDEADSAKLLVCLIEQGCGGGRKIASAGEVDEVGYGLRRCAGEAAMMMVVLEKSRPSRSSGCERTFRPVA